MDCKDIKELLYEFLTNRLNKELFQEVNEHLITCKRCQEDLQELRSTLSLLNEWKAPELSAGFRARVMEAIEERAERRHVPVFERIMNKVFRPYYLKLPLEGLAVAAMVVFALTLHKSFISEIEKTDRTQRGFEFAQKVTEAKKPIVVETGDIDKAMAQLLEIIQSHRGKLVRRKPVDSGMEMRFKLEKHEEEGFFKDLNQLGKVKKEKEGYKDGDGNIVVLLRKGL
jgi:hypothetical protein